jgi:hypothetical protein
MCEVSLVVALALLQQCNSTTSHFLRYTTMLDGFGVIVMQQCKQAVIEFHSKETVVYGLLLI